MTVLGVLAQNNFGDTRDGGMAGPMGLFIVVVLMIGTVLLIRNMNSRLRRLPDHFPAEGEGTEPEAGEGGPSPERSQPQA